MATETPTWPVLHDKVGMDVIPEIKLCDGERECPVLIYCFCMIFRQAWRK